MHWVHYFGRALIRILVFPFASWEVKGRENVPARGPLLIVSNHLHIADPPIVVTSIKLKAIFMAKEELFQNWWSRFWVRNFGAFPVRRGGVDREALRRAETQLREGGALIIFPEGSRSQWEQLKQGLPGAARLASHLDVPILPVGITGTEKLKKLRLRWPRHRIIVNIGQPFRLPPVNGKLSKEELNKRTDDIMRHIAALLPPEYRGVYAAPEDKLTGVSDEKKQTDN